MKALYALYSGPDEAQLAVDALRAASSEFHIDARQIVVVSQIPIEGYEFAEDHKRTPLFQLAFLGAVLGGSTGYFLTSLTQQAYPLPTGAMPLVPPWTNGIIVYEMTMLGAILFTLGTLLISTHLPTFRNPLSDPEVWSGKVLVGVTDPPDNFRRELEARLRHAGALEVRSKP